VKAACAGAVIVALAACGRAGSAPDPPTAGLDDQDARAIAPASTPQVKILRPDIRSLPAPTIALPVRESIRVIDAGAAPRAPLRYRWDASANREVVVEARLTSRRLADGAWSAPMPIAPIREGFGLITQPLAGGGARLSFRGAVAEVVAGKDAAAAARATEYLATYRALLEHRRGDAPLDDRGQLGAPAFADAPPASSNDRAVDEVTQRWLEAAVPLPEPAIGKGARWRVVTALRAGAAVVKQTADYALVEARPDRWIIDVDVRRIGEDQLVDAPGMPTGTVAELIALFRENRGRVELSPSLPWPIAGTLTTELRVHAKLGVPDVGVREDLSEDTGTLTFSTR